jgi:hypothetical protein
MRPPDHLLDGARPTVFLGFFRRLDMAELYEQKQIVGDLQNPAKDERCCKEWPSEHGACEGRTQAAAGLRGTDVTLAAAARSLSVTTAIT